MVYKTKYFSIKWNKWTQKIKLDLRILRVPIYFSPVSRIPIYYIYMVRVFQKYCAENGGDNKCSNYMQSITEPKLLSLMGLEH